MSKNENFGPQTGPAPDFLRNTYDKQFQKLITTDFGELRPCFCKEVLPGDSLKIDPMVAIRSHPIVFPINTRIKFYCHFFYGRNRILYKDFEDFIFNTREGLTPPMLLLTRERAKKMISTNSLGDNLGIPSTIGIDVPVDFTYSVELRSFSTYSSHNPLPFDDNSILQKLAGLYGQDGLISYEAINSYNITHFGIGYMSAPIENALTSLTFYSSPFRVSTSVSSSRRALLLCVNNPSGDRPDLHTKQILPPAYIDISVESLENDNVRLKYSIDASFDYLEYLSTYLQNNYGATYRFMFVSTENDSEGFLADEFFTRTPTSASLIPSSFVFNVVTEGIHDATEDPVIAQNKFVGSNPAIPLSSLAFRLYEFCCNYYYRNDQNNPYILDGVPQYNKFIPTDDGGWDTEEYLIHHRNWESDPFTTAVPSPQYGTAPLVGLTYSGGDTARVMTNVTDSDGNTKQLGITVGVDEDGTLTSVMQVDTGVPSGSLRRLMDGVDGIRLGMSINDLRNVNSFQRFLENVIRRGLRYRNQLLSHFGVSVDYPDIDIPQFIGGFSGDLTVMEVTNMAESADVALGDVAGKINAVISSNHSISIYCPEHGFVLGIFSIVPVPTYSQILPTMFTRYSYLDYFQKEFDKIGYVPIFHRNFLPLQTDDPNKILGYQRAWWDYMCSFDEVNGDFRTTLADFVLYRQFKEVPTLNESFLKVDSESLNNIFAVDKVDEKYLNSKKFMCQFYFQYSHKNMVSKFGVASLE